MPTSRGFVFIWPNSKTAVMGPQQLAGVMSIVRRAAAQAAGKPFDEEQDAMLRKAVEDQIESESLATFTSGQVFDDGIIDPRDTRTVLGIALSAAIRPRCKGAETFGVFGCNAIVELANHDRHFDQQDSDCQSRRDRPADHAHLPRDGHRDRGGLLRRRSRRAVRARSRRSRAARRHCGRRNRICASTRSSTPPARPAATPSIPATAFCPKTPTFARACQRGGHHVHRSAGRRDRGDGLEDRSQAADASRPTCRCCRAIEVGDQSADAGPAPGGAAGLAAADQGLGRRRRPRHAHRARRPAEFAALLETARAGVASRLRRRARCLSSPTSKRPGTSRFRSSATRTATSCICSSANARSSAAIRRSSKNRPRWRSTTQLRRAMTDAAVRAAKAIGYVNAGTVEFLLTPDGKFYFLEVNTRLQVEHPVTECVTGLDLVRLQILVAAGEPLPAGSSRGHDARPCHRSPAVCRRPAARLSALGRHAAPLSHSRPRPASASTRRSTTPAVISPYYDPMLAKVIVHAPTRAEAARRLSHALARAQIHGLRTNRELLVRTLEHPDFLRGQTDTHFLERHDPAALAAPLGDDHAERLHAAAAALASQAAATARGQSARPVALRLAKQSLAVSANAFSGRRRRDRRRIPLRARRLATADRRRGPAATCAAKPPRPSRSACRSPASSGPTTSTACGDTFYVDSPLGASALVELPAFPDPAGRSRGRFARGSAAGRGERSAR